MSKETLEALDRDVERLFFAGAQVARGDADLEARKAKIAPLGAKVPVMGKIAEQVEKVQKSSGKTASSELLSLGALMAQVRGAQAAPAPVTGDLAPLPATEPIESPLGATELSSLVGALSNAPDARHRPRVLLDAIERDTVRDLRVLPFCVAALSDSGIGHIVEEDLLPKLGSLVVPELYATIRIEKGKSLDAKKLRVLASIQKEAAKPLLLQAAEKGTPELREAAVRELGEIDPAAAEPIALKMLAADRSEDVKRAACSALGSSTSDEALEALLKAFTGSEKIRSYAGAALARLPNAKATDRAVALLTPDLLAMVPFKMPKDLRGAKKTAAEKEEREHHEQVRYLGAILDLLASRKDKDTSQTVLGIFRQHKVKDARSAAAQALLKSGYEGAFEELAPSVVDADWQTQSDFIEHIFTHDAARAFDRLGRFLTRINVRTANQLRFAEQILDHIAGVTEGAGEPDDEEAAAAAEGEQAGGKSASILEKDGRWIDAAIALLDKAELTDSALDVLSNTRSPKALDAALKLTAGKVTPAHAWRITQVLVRHKDPRVPAALISILDALKGYWGRRAAYNAMRTYDDPSVVPALKAWVAGKKRLEQRDKDEIATLLEFLERDRALTAGV